MCSQAGTPMYMAPEIIRGEEYSKAVDVYSYSLIVYELFIGNEPFVEGKSIFLILKNIQEGVRPDTSMINNNHQIEFLEMNNRSMK
ncbi:hypothetical protein TRFO_12068 [Tritrichomonas foetus]|uniref:Protein kinase domain-containing protein n=1 Tax=Tritrichomonas foetus TaxID=1144522 RepID=A0A1J4J2U0_9EUKA|nr:hypothetical protein TRFO_12068 [Tritrichomonas foetus]|eukprot:OHS93057.1 hypothetical protein TRFO_12068 [Tritrichomonas foetus]